MFVFKDAKLSLSPKNQEMAIVVEEPADNPEKRLSTSQPNQKTGLSVVTRGMQRIKLGDSSKAFLINNKNFLKEIKAISCDDNNSSSKEA